jgi:hypothetical protein
VSELAYAALVLLPVFVFVLALALFDARFDRR